jgi:hypothetical protein
MLIDRHLPELDETQIRHLVVNVPPEETWLAVMAVNLMEVGVALALGPARPPDAPSWTSAPSTGSSPSVGRR